MALRRNGYSTWQEALRALVKENGLEDSELGDISSRAISRGDWERLQPNLPYPDVHYTELELGLSRWVEVLELEVQRLRIAAAEIEASEPV